MSQVQSQTYFEPNSIQQKKTDWIKLLFNETNGIVKRAEIAVGHAN